MDFFDAVKKRYSVRSFKRKDVEKEKLNMIFAAANLAPSAGNLQAYEMVIVQGEETKGRISGIADQDFIAEAPVVLVIFANEKRSSVKYGRRGEFYCLLDATIAASYIQLAATALGLGTCWVGAFDDDELRKILNAPAHLKPVAIIPLGYPNDEPEEKERRKISDIIHEEKF